jgi:hypothetical protein
MKFCERKGLIDRQSFVAQYISLAVLSIGLSRHSPKPYQILLTSTLLVILSGITTLLGSDDLLAAFACGTAFAWE